MRRYFIISATLVCATVLANNATAQDYSTDIFYNDESGSALGCYVQPCGTYNVLWADVSNCKTKRYYCYYSHGSAVAVAACDTCDAGYNRVWANNNVGDCSPDDNYDIYGSDNAEGSSTYYGYMTCTCDASLCADVGTWSNYGTGYQRRSKYTCQSGTCKATSTYEYRCAAGYYGTSTNGTSGCNPCPTWSGVYTNSARTTAARGTSNAGTTAVSGCFIPAGTYYDATGTFILTGSCSYK